MTEPIYEYTYVKGKGWLNLPDDALITNDSEGKALYLEYRRPEIGETFVFSQETKSIDTNHIRNYPYKRFPVFGRDRYPNELALHSPTVVMIPL